MKIKRMVSWICSMLVVAMVIGMIPTQTASAAIAMPDKVSKNTKTFNFTGKVGWYYDQGSKDEFGGYFKTLNEERKYFYGDNASKFKVSMKKDKDGVWHLTATGTGYVKLNLNSKVTSKNYEIVDITNKREVTTGYDQKTYSKINKKSGNYLIILVGYTHGKTEDVYFQVCDMDKFERVTKKLHLRVTVKDNPQTIEEIEWDQMMKELKEKDYSNSPDADLERVYDVWRAVDDWYNLFGAIGALKERGYFTKYDVLTDIDAAREFDPDWEKEYCKWNYAMWHVGVCEDNATMFTMLCDELGIESKLWKLQPCR